MEEPTYELYHYGVKGMKWGVRRQKAIDKQRAVVSKKRKNVEKEQQKLRDAQGKIDLRTNNTRRSIIDPEYRKSKEWKKIVRDSRYEQAKTLLLGENRTLSKRNAEWELEQAMRKLDKLMYGMSDIPLSLISPKMEAAGRAAIKTAGIITSGLAVSTAASKYLSGDNFNNIRDFVQNVSRDFSRDLQRNVNTLRRELYHYGIKGQKWGVRRFQNKDGSLTNAGRNRYKTSYGSSTAKASTAANARDHSKSNKSELAIFLTYATLDILTLNPVGLLSDTHRLVKAGSSFVKRKIYDSEREKCELDKKTGLLLKNKEMSIKDDVSRVNPSVNNFDGNTKNNCMLCTSTYDLRRRGYEVRAKEASYGYYASDLKAWYPNVKVNTVAVPLNDKGKADTKTIISSVKSQLTSQGNGARGNLMITWKSTRGGHSVAYEVVDGALKIIDAQINKIYDNPDKFLKHIASDVQYARLDNVDFNAKTIKEVGK